MYLREPVRPVSWYVPLGSLPLHKKFDVFSNVKSNIFWFKISVPCTFTSAAPHIAGLVIGMYFAVWFAKLDAGTA